MLKADKALQHIGYVHSTHHKGYTISCGKREHTQLTVVVYIGRKWTTREPHPPPKKTQKTQQQKTTTTTLSSML